MAFLSWATINTSSKYSVVQSHLFFGSSLLQSVVILLTLALQCGTGNVGVVCPNRFLENVAARIKSYTLIFIFILFTLTNKLLFNIDYRFCSPIMFNGIIHNHFITFRHEPTCWTLTRRSIP